MTKKAGFEDYHGNSDMEDLTFDYKMVEGHPGERSAVMNAVRGSERAREVFDYEEITDIKFELEDIEGIKFGEPYKIRVNLEVI